MVNLSSIRHFLRYNDWANGELLRAASGLADEALDRAFDLGVGSLRRTLIHIYNAEHVWLNRWHGRTETKWPSENEPETIGALTQRFAAHYAVRDAYLNGLSDDDLAATVTYRDSKGSLFKAARADMLMQACVHSTHHRSQAVNMLRRVGAGLVELDYMMWLRQGT